MAAPTDTNAPTKLQRVTFKKPTLKGKRGISVLTHTPMLAAVVQTLVPGGRQGLHAHGSYDGFYFVLSGRARFYGRGNKMFAEVGPNEGVLVPRGEPYAFEAVDQEVQMIAIDAIDTTAEDTFYSLEDGANAVQFEMFAADGSNLNLKADRVENIKA
jgi:mannose-6-phosphate isomerase-like protein (cupin superfamily)